MDSDRPEWVSPSMAARVLGISYSRVRQLALAGRLETRKTSLGMEIEYASLERMAAEREARL